MFDFSRLFSDPSAILACFGPIIGFLLGSFVKWIDHFFFDDCNPDEMEE